MSTKEQYASDAEVRAPNNNFVESGLTLPELAFLTGTTTEIIKQLAEWDLIVPCEQSETILFKTETVQTVRKIMRLRRHLQISIDSMALIFDLLDRIDALEERIKALEKE